MAVRQEKAQAVAEIKDRLEKVQSIVLVDYRGLNVGEVTDLRNQLRKSGVEFRVLKNTLIRIAAKDLGIEGLDPYLEGPTAVAFGVEDAVAPAKVLADFAKDHKNLELKAGLIEGKVIDAAGVKALADLPSREVLLSQVVGLFQAPLRNLANVLQGPLRKTVYALNAIKEQKESA